MRLDICDAYKAKEMGYRGKIICFGCKNCINERKIREGQEEKQIHKQIIKATQ